MLDDTAKDEAQAAIAASRAELEGTAESRATRHASAKVFVGLKGRQYLIKNFERRGALDYNARRELRPVFHGPDTATHKKATDGGKKDLKREAAVRKRENGDWSATEVNAVADWRARGEPGGMAQLAKECGRSVDTVRRNINKPPVLPAEPRLNATAGNDSLLGSFEAS